MSPVTICRDLQSIRSDWRERADLVERLTWLNDFFEGRAKAEAANHRQGRRIILDIIAATGLPGAVVAHWLDQLEKDGRLDWRPTGKMDLNL